MTTWDCEAYGPGAADVGALCFLAGETGTRVCADRAVCNTTMTAERQRVFARIQERGASPDADDADRFLAAEFTAPEQLLNAEAEPT
jgi:hypothetical protein